MRIRKINRYIENCYKLRNATALLEKVYALEAEINSTNLFTNCFPSFFELICLLTVIAGTNLPAPVSQANVWSNKEVKRGKRNITNHLIAGHFNFLCDVLLSCRKKQLQQHSHWSDAPTRYPYKEAGHSPLERPFLSGHLDLHLHPSRKQSRNYFSPISFSS